MKNKEFKLFEYRIKYNAGSEHSAIDSYHYYHAYNAEEAFQFHVEVMANKDAEGQNISVEKFNPYSGDWENETPENLK